MPEKISAPRYMPKKLTVSGLVNNPLRLHVEDLRQMEVVELNNLKRFYSIGMGDGIAEKYQGVLLRTLTHSGGPVWGIGVKSGRA
ncbi:MAG: hypothetical protein A4E70_01093 [Syntrophus sp. PtaU1.Bin005]|jgi:DMSO/TMAO reductase YedYZ molybdopterin-dependent catalytic subunit|nr:MAG: hypothetical protein A4E70_01093 [Syntrophus sp. PtaU1.Bin005]